MIYLPIYFQMELGYDTVKAGLSLLAYTLPGSMVAGVGLGLTNTPVTNTTTGTVSGGRAGAGALVHGFEGEKVSGR